MQLIVSKKTVKSGRGGKASRDIVVPQFFVEDDIADEILDEINSTNPDKAIEFVVPDLPIFKDVEDYRKTIVAEKRKVVLGKLSPAEIATLGFITEAKEAKESGHIPKRRGRKPKVAVATE